MSERSPMEKYLKALDRYVSAHRINNIGASRIEAQLLELAPDRSNEAQERRADLLSLLAAAENATVGVRAELVPALKELVESWSPKSIERLKAENERLAELFDTYAKHLPSCAWLQRHDPPCDCGVDAACDEVEAMGFKIGPHKAPI